MMKDYLNNNGTINAEYRRIIQHCVYKFKCGSIPTEDLQGEAYIHLIEACRDYDETSDVPLRVFCLQRIYWGLSKFYKENKYPIRIARSHDQTKLFYNLHKHLDSKEHLSEADIKEVAKLYNVSKNDVKDMAMRMQSNPEFYEEMLDPEEVNITESNVYTLRILDTLKSLGPLKYDIVVSYFLHDVSMTELGRRHGKTRQRMCALRDAALKEMRELLT